jgi:microcystin-dependent protein
LIERLRKLRESPRPRDHLYAVVVDSALTDRLNELSDRQIGQLLFDFCWAQLPDLLGRVPINFGSGAGLSPRDIGQNGGTENVTLISSEMPRHNHSIGVNDTAGTNDNPTNSILAKAKLEASRNHEAVLNYTGSMATTPLAPIAVSQAGGSQPHANMQPYLAVNFIMALTGTYPTRS